MATMLASCFALSGCGGGGGGQNEDGRKVSFLARIFGESDSSKQLGDTKKRELLESISGVYAFSDGEGTISLNYANNAMSILVGDAPFAVTLGDVDVNNGTVNVLKKNSETGADDIMTIRKVWNAEKTAFHIDIVFPSGQRHGATFVRKFSADDARRAAALGSPVTQMQPGVQPGAPAPQYEQAAARQEQAAAQPAAVQQPAVTRPAEAVVQPIPIPEYPDDPVGPTAEYRTCLKEKAGKADQAGMVECSRWELDRQRNSLNLAWKPALEMVQDKEEMVAAQKRWVNTRNKVCASRGDQSTLYGEWQNLDCMVVKTAARAHELATMREQRQ